MLYLMVMGALPHGQAPRRAQIEIPEEWFFRIGQDDAEAFCCLYEHTSRIMYTYILSLVRQHDDALDLLQDTFCKIRAAAHLYRPMGKPLAWMFTIARNLCNTHLKRSQRFLPAVQEENSLALSYVSDPLDRLALEQALACLDEQERTVVLLHAVSGLKHREIAQSLSLPLSTVLSKYHRALKKLRVRLSEEEALHAETQPH